MQRTIWQADSFSAIQDIPRTQQHKTSSPVHNVPNWNPPPLSATITAPIAQLTGSPCHSSCCAADCRSAGVRTHVLKVYGSASWTGGVWPRLSWCCSMDRRHFHRPPLPRMENVYPQRPSCIPLSTSAWDPAPTERDRCSAVQVFYRAIRKHAARHDTQPVPTSLPVSETHINKKSQVSKPSV